MNILIRGAKATRLKKPPHRAEGFFVNMGLAALCLALGERPFIKLA